MRTSGGRRVSRYSGHSHKGKLSRATTPYCLSPLQTEAVAMDQLGPQTEVDFLSGFVALRDGSMPAVRSRARGTDQDPVRRTSSRKTNQGPSGRIRATQDEARPCGTITLAQLGSG